MLSRFILLSSALVALVSGGRLPDDYTSPTDTPLKVVGGVLAPAEEYGYVAYINVGNVGGAQQARRGSSGLTITTSNNHRTFVEKKVLMLFPCPPWYSLVGVGQGYCSGVLYADEYLLTAAHCFVGSTGDNTYNVTEVKVTLGINDL